MHEEVLPLFPLPLVLFPRTTLPLHIFEDRYKEMIGEALAAESEFGIVLARDGGIVNMGCTAAIDHVVQRYPDGRLDIVTIGRRRFEVTELVEGRSFVQGKVLYFDDDEFDPAPADLKRRALEAYSDARLATASADAAEPHWDDPQLSFQLAQIVNDVDFRQRLLTYRSEQMRLKELADFFPEYIIRWKHTEKVKEVAPRNGHGTIVPPSLV